jgi:L-aspartate oxidase
VNLSPDFIVIGSGIAGLRAAIALAPVGRVLILTKAEPTESNTGYAQGGIAVALGDDDSPALHAADTIKAGDGLCDEDAVRVLVEQGPPYVTELIEWGTRFDRDESGRPARGREAAHSVRRVLHAGDTTGREIGRVLWNRVSALPSVETANHALVTELLVEDGCVTGVRFFDQFGFPRDARARATLLANPPVATGDGVALAFHAGARVADLEFVQFHPTALNVRGAPRFLISEALRGDGARLINGRGQPFMTRYHPDGDLAPRDVVARAVLEVREETGAPVYLDATAVPDLARRFPTADEQCREVGLDIATQPVPVAPAAHYCMGGVLTDLWGRTGVSALFAAGEVASTGVHGANRLASNSLAEALVFGRRAALADDGVLATQPVDALDAEPAGAMALATIRERADRFLGVRRDGPELDKLAAEIVSAADPGGGRAATLVAWLMTGSASRRTESRGGHFRVDHPAPDPAWAVRQVVDHRGWSTLASPAPV